MSQLDILFVLYPEVTHLDFTGPHQVLCRLPGARVTVASMGGVDIVGDGLTFTNLADLKAVASCDIICIPGGFRTTAAILDADFMAEVTRLAKGAKYLTSVCTGSLNPGGDRVDQGPPRGLSLGLAGATELPLV